MYPVGGSHDISAISSGCSDGVSEDVVRTKGPVRPLDYDGY